MWASASSGQEKSAKVDKCHRHHGLGACVWARARVCTCICARVCGLLLSVLLCVCVSYCLCTQVLPGHLTRPGLVEPRLETRATRRLSQPWSRPGTSEPASRPKRPGRPGNARAAGARPSSHQRVSKGRALSADSARAPNALPSPQGLRISGAVGPRPDAAAPLRRTGPAAATTKSRPRRRPRARQPAPTAGRGRAG